MLPWIMRAPVPADPRTVTTVRHAAEVPARELGLDPDAVAAIWDAVESLYASGVHPAIQLCVRHRGAVLLDRAIGHARGGGPDDPPDAPKVACTPDTPFLLFSASKAVTAMLVHLLDERNLIRLDDPVCEYVPEFGVHGKQWITVRHVLTHRAGIPNLPPEVMQLDNLADPEVVRRLVCDAKPVWRPGRQLAYHAVTGGFVLGELIERVTGRDPRTFLEESIRRPLGMRWMSYGVAPEDIGAVARSYATGPRPTFPISTLLRRAIGVSYEQATQDSNDPRFLRAIVPAGNLVATADEMSRFFQLLLDGGQLDGVRIFDPRTIRRATIEQSYLEIDFTLAMPVRYGMGFMLGADWFSPYGPYTRHAFGHIGYTNIVCWADPERQVAAAIMTSGKPLLYPEIYWLWETMHRIGLACPREPGRLVQRGPLRDEPTLRAMPEA